MTTKDTLHQIVGQLPDDRTDLALMLLEDLTDAADDGGPPLDPATLASLDRGLADLSADRVKTLSQYERERGV